MFKALLTCINQESLQSLRHLKNECEVIKLSYLKLVTAFETQNLYNVDSLQGLLI